jgi:acyl-CoA thioesterase-1
LQAQEEWPFLLQQQLQEQKLPYKIVNASISGETTAGGLRRFASTFNKYQPAIVILELGANDGLRGQSLETMSTNLGIMIRYSQRHQAKVLLVSMRIPPNYGKRYTRDFEQVFTDLQKQHNIALSGFLMGSLSGHPELVQKDGLHPTAAAQPLLLATVWKSLKPLLQTK